MSKPQPSRFDYVKYDDIAADKQATLKKMFTELEGAIESLLPGSRAKAKLEKYIKDFTAQQLS